MFTQQDVELGVASIRIPTLGRLRQENSQVRANLDYILGPCSKKFPHPLSPWISAATSHCLCLGPKYFLASWPQTELSGNMGSSL